VNYKNIINRKRQEAHQKKVQVVILRR